MFQSFRAALFVVSTICFGAFPALAQEHLTCLITKNNTNPFFVKMKEGAEAKAKEMGMDFQAYAGEKDGDAAPQITAIENCVAAGAKGILITPSNDSVGPALKAAREAGVLVIVVESNLAESEASDSLIVTDWDAATRSVNEWISADSSTNSSSISVLSMSQTGSLPAEAEKLLDGGLVQSDGNNLITFDQFSENAILAAARDGRMTVSSAASFSGDCDFAAGEFPAKRTLSVLEQPVQIGAIGVAVVSSFTRDGTKPESVLFSEPLFITDSPVAGVNSISLADAQDFCTGRFEASREDFFWSSASSEESCPACPKNGVCPKSVLMAEKECCPKNGVCPK